MKYVAFLRGVNVGGKAMIKMADLQTALSEAGLEEVKTYIQSGNVIFATKLTTHKSARLVEKVIQDTFGLAVRAVVFSATDWAKVIGAAPAWWGAKPDWKHNLLILLPPATSSEVIRATGELKPDIEAAQAGPGVVYQSILFTKFGQTTGGKLASKPVYKEITIRNYNTAQKIYQLLTAWTPSD